MPATTNALIETLAESCVSDMGDIFWDFDPDRDSRLEYADPEQVVLASVKKTLKELTEQFDTSPVYSKTLQSEYEAVVASLSNSPNDREVIGALVRESAWTEQGAIEILRLARRYGFSILRNALALASALDIEDGESGL